MDWSSLQPFLARNPDSLDEFEYEVDAPLPLTVIQGFSPEVEDRFNLERFASDDVDPLDFWQKLEVRGTHIPSMAGYLHVRAYADRANCTEITDFSQ